VFCIVTNPVRARGALAHAAHGARQPHPVRRGGSGAWVWLAIVLWALPAMCSSGSYDCSALIERKREGE
jgi:hypothetical protein